MQSYSITLREIGRLTAPSLSSPPPAEASLAPFCAEKLQNTSEVGTLSASEGWGEFDDWDPLQSLPSEGELDCEVRQKAKGRDEALVHVAESTNFDLRQSLPCGSKSSDAVIDELDLLMNDLAVTSKANVAPIKVPEKTASKGLTPQPTETGQSWDDFGRQLVPKVGVPKSPLNVMFSECKKFVATLGDGVVRVYSDRNQSSSLSFLEEIGILRVSEGSSSIAVTCFSFLSLKENAAPCVIAGSESGSVHGFNLHGIPIFKLFYLNDAVTDIYATADETILLVYANSLLIVELNVSDLGRLSERFSGSLLEYCEPKPNSTLRFMPPQSVSSKSPTLVTLISLPDTLFPVGYANPTTNQELLSQMNALHYDDTNSSVSLTEKLIEVYRQRYERRFALLWSEASVNGNGSRIQTFSLTTCALAVNPRTVHCKSGELSYSQETSQNENLSFQALLQTTNEIGDKAATTATTVFNSLFKGMFSNSQNSILQAQDSRQNSEKGDPLLEGLFGQPKTANVLNQRSSRQLNGYYSHNRLGLVQESPPRALKHTFEMIVLGLQSQSGGVKPYFTSSTTCPQLLLLHFPSVPSTYVIDSANCLIVSYTVDASHSSCCWCDINDEPPQVLFVKSQVGTSDSLLVAYSPFNLKSAPLVSHSIPPGLFQSPALTASPTSSPILYDSAMPSRLFSVCLNCN